MSDFLNLKPSLIHREIRDTMFGDLPLSRLVQVRHTAPLTEPWASFQRARKLIEAGDQHDLQPSKVNNHIIPHIRSRSAAEEFRPQLNQECKQCKSHLRFA